MKFKIRLGVSSCLLGNPVRYDGGHKLDRFISDTLSRYCDFIPVCPEVECGLPVPREAMRLTGELGAPRLISRSGIDHTDRMLSYCHKKISELAKENLNGFIFKKNSPSSGLYRVKIYSNENNSFKTGSGLFAASFVKAFPLLPVEEEGRLMDPFLRENFIEKIFCYQRWKDFLNERPDYKKLIAFHSNHKLQLMAHGSKNLYELGRLVAEGKKSEQNSLLADYEQLLMKSLDLKATVKKNVNVLQHIMGYFKKQISTDEKTELLEVISRYAAGIVPLIVPLTLLNHYIRKYDVSYLKAQTYLEPHPAELMLRNHV